MLRTKLNRPILLKRLVRRSYLIEKLDKANQLPFVLVSAPAGYGKSVLISQWLEHTQNNYAWLSLDESMDDLASFISYFIQMLNDSGSIDKQKIKILDQDLRFLSLEAIINIIINSLNAVEKQTILILDDYYLMKNQEIHQLVETVIKENLINVQIVLITRWDPPFQLRELRLYQMMSELRMGDLKFTEHEIAQLLAIEHHVNFSDAEILEFAAKTEGWILAIRMILMARSIKVPESNNGGFEILTNDLDQLMSLISENLEHGFIRQMQLSAFCDRFNADLINSICTFAFPDSCKGDVFISKMKELNFFLIPIIEDKSWYRYHHLFGDILRRQLKKIEPEIIKPLYRHISSWYAGKGMIEEAIQYAIKAEDFELACGLISEHRKTVLDQGYWWVVQRWLERIPRQIRNANIDMLLTELLVCEETWNLEDFSSILDTAEAIGFENSSDENISLYLFHLGYFLTFVKPDPKKAVESLERSKALCYDESYMFGGRRELILASSRQMLGLTTLALQSLEEMQEKFDPSSKMYVRIVHAKVLVHLLSGNFESANIETKKMLFLVQDSDLLYTKGWGSYFRGNVAFQSYHEDEAIDALKEALTFEGVINYRVNFDVLAGLILISSLKKDEKATALFLEQMYLLAAKLKDSKFQNYYRSVQARVNWHAGQGDKELGWAKLDWSKQQPFSYLFLIDLPDLTKMRIVVSHGSHDQVEEAISVLEEVETKLENVHNRYQQIDIVLLKAMGLFRLRRKKVAAKWLEHALILADRKDIIRPIIEAFRVMPDLFNLIAFTAVNQRLLSRIGIDLSTSNSSAYPILNSQNLTIRELEVVSLIANGLRNKEVADQLNISTVTVKSHLTNIYRKLNVSNRTSMLRIMRDS